MVILLEGKGSEWPIAIAISTVIPQDHAVSVAPGMRARHRSLTRDFADMGELATSSRAIVANAAHCILQTSNSELACTSKQGGRELKS